MTALTLLAGPEPVDVMDAVSRFRLVHDRLTYEPEQANVENCERSLRLAAQALVQEWRRVQMLKADPNALKPQPRPSAAESMKRVDEILDRREQHERTKGLREVPQLTHA